MEVMNNNFESLTNTIQRKQSNFSRKIGDINQLKKMESEDRALRKSIQEFDMVNYKNVAD